MEIGDTKKILRLDLPSTNERDLISTRLNPNFTGRETELEQLHSRLWAQACGRQCVVLKVEVAGLGWLLPDAAPCRVQTLPVGPTL
jgi:hypothetical protein